MDLMYLLPVQVLPRPKQAQFLFSFDFDDTLFSPGEQTEVRRKFFSIMRALRTRYNVLWGINTGRDPAYLRDGLREFFMGVPEAFVPDFTVTMERNVHLACGEGLLKPVEIWNSACSLAHDNLFARYGDILESLLERLERQFSEAGLRRQDNDAYSLVVDDACSLDDVSCVIQETIGAYQEIVTQRAGPYLRFSHRDYNKGTSLAFVAGQFGISVRNVAIFGDGHNDLDAMSYLPEAFRCCPSNAAEEVKGMVADGNGYISTMARTCGVLDGLIHGVFPHFGMTQM